MIDVYIGYNVYIYIYIMCVCVYIYIYVYMLHIYPSASKLTNLKMTFSLKDLQSNLSYVY